MCNERYFEAWFNHNYDALVQEVKPHEFLEKMRRDGMKSQVVNLSTVTLYITYHTPMTPADARLIVDDMLFNELPHPDQPAYRGVKGGQDGPPANQLPLFPPVGQGGR